MGFLYYNSVGDGICIGPDGKIWFSDVNQIGKISPQNGNIKDYSIPDGDANDITAGPDGNLWFTSGYMNQIGKISPINGKITEYPVPTKSAGPDSITAVRMAIYASQKKSVTKLVKSLLLPTSLQNMLFLQLILTLAALLLDRW